jgi:hypothetical protein
MSDRPDFTANTALNAVADTLDNLPVSINAQSIGSLAVDIAAQSAGEVDIDLSTNSAGDIDISFQSQSQGVESGTEFAARQGDSFTRSTRDILSPGDFISKTLFDNTTGGPVILESLTMASFRDFTENSLVNFGVSTDDPFVDDVELIVSPATAPFAFDPGIRIEDTGNIGVVLENNSTVQSTIEAQGVFREL